MTLSDNVLREITKVRPLCKDDQTVIDLARDLLAARVAIRRLSKLGQWYAENAAMRDEIRETATRALGPPAKGKARR